MSGVTDNYGLILPAAGEPYDVAIPNANNIEIDKQIKYAKRILHFEAASVQNDMPANILWGPGAVVGLVDNTTSKNNTEFIDMVSGANNSPNDGLKLTKEGIYTVTWGMGNNTASGITLWHIVCFDGTNTTTANATVVGRSPVFTVPPGDWYFNYAHNFYVPAAGKVIYFKYSSGTASASMSHRIRVTKLF